MNQVPYFQPVMNAQPGMNFQPGMNIQPNIPNQAGYQNGFNQAGTFVNQVDAPMVMQP